MEPPTWDRAITAVDYAYPWDSLITQFKFQESPAWARHFANLMLSTPWVAPALEETDFVIPMPLATARLRERGYNQSTLLARYLSPAKTLENVLLRVINTPAQSTLDRKDRQSNVRYAFAMEPSRQGVVANKRIVLVDDVMTSGASMGAASATLKQAGAIHVTALVFARTGVDTATA
jgi:ComF family protein